MRLRQRRYASIHVLYITRLPLGDLTRHSTDCDDSNNTDFQYAVGS